MMNPIPRDRQKQNVETVVQRASHLMWLEWQLSVHQRWQQWLIRGWILSILACAVLFFVGLPLLEQLLALSDEVTLITAAGVRLELLALLYLTGRVVRRRRAIETEIEQSLK
jgi:hypothetical protein